MHRPGRPGRPGLSRTATDFPAIPSTHARPTMHTPRQRGFTMLQTIACVMVVGVEAESPAAESGIQRGDLILSVNQRKTATLKEYAAAMKEAEKKGTAALLVRRGNASI